MGSAGRHVRSVRQIADNSERRYVATPDRLKVMTMRLDAFGGWPGVLVKLIRREDLPGGEAAATLAVLPRSLRCEKVTVVLEQPPAT
jgi:hypothetical protein